MMKPRSGSRWCVRCGVAGVTLAALVGCAVGGGAQVGEVAGTTQRSVRPPTGQALPELSKEPTLAEYLTYAALNNPGLEAAFNRWKAALQKVPQVRSLADPRFSYRYFIEQVETRVGPQRQSFGLSQTFPWFGTLELRGDVALEAAKAARQRYEAQKLRLFYRVKNAYYEYYYLARAIAIVRENRNLVKYFEQVVRIRYQAAAAAHLDTFRAQVELGKLEDRLRTLIDLRGPIVARLNAALSRPTEAELPWPTSIPEEKIETSDQEILTWLREASPQIREMEHQIERERHAIELARKQYYPDFTLGLNYIDTGSAAMPGAQDSGKDPLMATVSVNVPIWLARYSAAVREAQARHLAALKAKADRENTLGAEVKLVLYRFRDAERKIDLYRDTLVPKAEQSLKALDAAFRAGQASFLDLVDGQRILLEFQLAYERALADLAQRLAQLEMLVGREIPRGPVETAGDQGEADVGDAERVTPEEASPAAEQGQGSHGKHEGQ